MNRRGAAAAIIARIKVSGRNHYEWIFYRINKNKLVGPASYPPRNRTPASSGARKVYGAPKLWYVRLCLWYTPQGGAGERSTPTPHSSGLAAAAPRTYELWGYMGMGKDLGCVLTFGRRL